MRRDKRKFDRSSYCSSECKQESCDSDLDDGNKEDRVESSSDEEELNEDETEDIEEGQDEEKNDDNDYDYDDDDDNENETETEKINRILKTSIFQSEMPGCIVPIADAHLSRALAQGEN